MPIYKRCSKCGKRILYNDVCVCQKNRYKEYDKYKKNNKEKIFYSSAAWQAVRKLAINKYHGIDIYSYYIFGVIESGQVVHHIEPVKEAWGKRFMLSNLIYITESNHRLIHKQMESNAKEVKKILSELIKKFEENNRGS